MLELSYYLQSITFIYQIFSEKCSGRKDTAKIARMIFGMKGLQ